MTMIKGYDTNTRVQWNNEEGSIAMGTVREVFYQSTTIRRDGQTFNVQVNGQSPVYLIEIDHRGGELILKDHLDVILRGISHDA